MHPDPLFGNSTDNRFETGGEHGCESQYVALGITGRRKVNSLDSDFVLLAAPVMPAKDHWRAGA